MPVLIAVLGARWLIGSPSVLTGQEWTGDPRVDLPIVYLHPEDIDIIAAPFPISDYVTLANMYAEASFELYPYYYNLNITLSLDAPGLARQCGVVAAEAAAVQKR